MREQIRAGLLALALIASCRKGAGSGSSAASGICAYIYSDWNACPNSWSWTT